MDHVLVKYLPHLLLLRHLASQTESSLQKLRRTTHVSARNEERTYYLMQNS